MIDELAPYEYLDRALMHAEVENIICVGQVVMALQKHFEVEPIDLELFEMLAEIVAVIYLRLKFEHEVSAELN